jgi:hypothetical protein
MGRTYSNGESSGIRTNNPSGLNFYFTDQSGATPDSCGILTPHTLTSLLPKYSPNTRFLTGLFISNQNGVLKYTTPATGGQISSIPPLFGSPEAYKFIAICAPPDEWPMSITFSVSPFPYFGSAILA